MGMAKARKKKQTPESLWLVMKIRRSIITIIGDVERSMPIDGLYGYVPVYEKYDDALADAGDESLVVGIREVR